MKIDKIENCFVFCVVFSFSFSSSSSYSEFFGVVLDCFNLGLLVNIIQVVEVYEKK
jgi:hypothetical protein